MSLTVEVERRFSNGLAFQWFYVLNNDMICGSRGEAVNSTVPDPATFLPGTVPTNYDQMNRYWDYRRDTAIPHHRVNFDMVYELPVGTGKKFLPNAKGVTNRLLGGWQMSAYGTTSSRYFSLPTSDWAFPSPVQIYGFKYPIQDCRATTATATAASCIPGYLYYNGYIPANQINSNNSKGVPDGVMGVPASYVPSSEPLNPTPATGCPPGNALCGTDNVYVKLSNGTLQLVAYGNNGNHPWRQQYIPGPWTTPAINASIFKVIPINERFRLRLSLDAFNALNMPGMNMPASATGIIAMNTSSNSPRELQWGLRLIW